MFNFFGPFARDPVEQLLQLYRITHRGGGGQITTVTGVSPLVLANALHKPIQSLTQYGLCTQDGTPTPDAPVDIVCNNGTIKVRRQSGLPVGYQMVEWLKPAGSIVITGFKTKSTQEITTVFYRERSGASYLYSSDTATSGTTNTTAYLTSGAGNWRWNGKSYSIGVSTGIKITSIQNKDGVWLNGTKYGYYTDAGDFVSANDLRLSSSENTTVRIESQTIREGEIVTLDLVAVQRLSDSAYGFYDKVSGEFYTNAEATFAAGDPIADPIEIYTDGTPEVLTVSAAGAETQTVTVPMLLGVGDDKDEVELINGPKTVRIRLYVITGSEAWTENTTYSGTFYADCLPQEVKHPAMSLFTRYKGVDSSTSVAGLTNGAAKCGTSSYRQRIYIRDTSCADADAFKAKLSGFYADGAPCIVAFVLATETTEQGAAHALHTAEGDNVVDVSAAVGSVELEVEYTAAAAGG